MSEPRKDKFTQENYAATSGSKDFEFKAFIKTIEEAKVLDTFAKAVFPKIKTGKNLLKNKSAPESEKIEVIKSPEINNSAKNFKKEVSENLNTAIYPTVDGLDKPSRLFDNLNYNITLERGLVTKKISDTWGCGAVVDYFDKTAGFHLSRQKPDSNEKFESALEFDPLDKRVKVDGKYNTENSSLRTGVIFGNDYLGVTTTYKLSLTPNESIKAKAAFSKGKTDVYVNYYKKFRDKTLMTLGVYGNNNEIGFRGHLYFYTK